MSTVTGDRRFTALISDSQSPSGDPTQTGWTQVFKNTFTTSDGGVYYVYSRVSDGTDPGSLNWSTGAGISLIGIDASVHDTLGGAGTINRSQSTVVDSNNAFNIAVTSSAFAASAITTVTCTVIMIVFIDNSPGGTVTYTPPSGYSSADEATDGGFYNGALFYKTGVAAGFDGVLSATAIGSGSAGYGVYVAAIEEAAGGGGGGGHPAIRRLGLTELGRDGVSFNPASHRRGGEFVMENGIYRKAA